MNNELVCPRCSSIEIYRSRRRGLAFERFLLPLAGFRPYRCIRCDKRFYSRIPRNSSVPEQQRVSPMQTGNWLNSDRTVQEPVQKKSAAAPNAANAGELEWLLCLAATLEA